MPNNTQLLAQLQLLEEVFQEHQLETHLLHEFQGKRDVIQAVARNIEEQQFIVSIIGTMKSGKSTFINAMLGKDFMPNETAACTLVPTRIAIEPSTGAVMKITKDGSFALEGDGAVSELMHADVKQYRERLENGQAIDLLHYETSHTFYDLQPNGANKIVLVDTPGPNEMKTFDTNRLDLEQIFLQSLYETSYLLFIIDVQYFKDEENVKLIQHIQHKRPELLEHTTFIVNKADRFLKTKDTTLEQTIEEVRAALISWGIQEPKLFAVSSKQALFSRLIEDKQVEAPKNWFKKLVALVKKQEGPDYSELEEELDGLLPTREIELEGRRFYETLAPEEAFEDMMQQSNIRAVEQHLLHDIFQRDHDILQSIQVQSYAREQQWIEKMVTNYLSMYRNQKSELLQDEVFERQRKYVDVINKLLNMKENVTVGKLEVPSKANIRSELASYVNIEYYETELNYLNRSSYKSEYDEELSERYTATYDVMQDMISEYYRYMDRLQDELAAGKKHIVKQILHENTTKIQHTLAKHENNINQLLQSLDLNLSFNVKRAADMSSSNQFNVSIPSEPHLWIDSTRRYDTKFFGLKDVTYYVYKLQGGASFGDDAAYRANTMLAETVAEIMGDVSDMNGGAIAEHFKEQIDLTIEKIELNLQQVEAKCAQIAQQLFQIESREMAFAKVIGADVERSQIALNTIKGRTAKQVVPAFHIRKMDYNDKLTAIGLKYFSN